jgi:hypothetical protein
LAVSGRPWKDRMAHNAPESKRLREEARTQMQDLHGFDCTAAAELFMIDPKKLKGRVTCKRFDTGADALRFAIEEIPSLAGAYLEVNDARFGSQEIKYVYANAGYPLRSVATGA